MSILCTSKSVFRKPYNVRQMLRRISEIKSGVSQRSIPEPTLYTLYTADLSNREDVTTATFADNTAILGLSSSNHEASNKVQRQPNKVQKWKIKFSSNKRIHTTFRTRKYGCPPITLNNVILPEKDEVQYLGLPTFKCQSLITERNELNLKRRKLNYITRQSSKLLLNIVNKVISKPVWSYGIELWGTASKSNACIFSVTS